MERIEMIEERSDCTVYKPIIWQFADRNSHFKKSDSS